MKREPRFGGAVMLWQLRVPMPAAVPLPRCQGNSPCWAGPEQQLSPRALWLRARWDEAELFALSLGKPSPCRCRGWECSPFPEEHRTAEPTVGKGKPHQFTPFDTLGTLVALK